MAVVFDHPKSLLDVSTHFCPGCGHGIVHRLVCEVIDEWASRATPSALFR